jgi:hypothetical protein
MVAAAATLPKDEAGRIYVWIASLFIVFLLAGFGPTYLLAVPLGRFEGPAILHIHGALFIAWPVLFLVQASLAARGSLRLHRSLGLLGIALASAMVFSGTAAVSSSLHAWIDRGVGEEGRGITVIAFTNLVLFASFVTAAIVNRRRSDWHKRLMLLATLSIMGAAVARIAFNIATAPAPFARPGLGVPPDPVLVVVPFLVLDALILGAVAFHDRRTRGHVHPAYVIGGAVLVLVHATRHLVVSTAAWRAVTDSLIALSS